jgi:uncharacterized protein (TIGR02453 family)
MSTTHTLDLEPALHFLNQLSRHNNKAWFDQHRQDYGTGREKFEWLIDILIDEFREPDHLQGLSAKECVARIYRDVRFAKDKSPYKTNFGAIVAPGGWKSKLQGYYVGIQPGGESIVGGGLYNPTPEQLERFRRAIDQDATAFRKVIEAPAFVEAFGGLSGERLKTAPKGYDRGHPQIALLQLKQVVVIRRFSDQEVLSADFVARVIHLCRMMRPFLDILNGILG